MSGMRYKHSTAQIQLHLTYVLFSHTQSSKIERILHHFWCCLDCIADTVIDLASRDSVLKAFTVLSACDQSSDIIQSSLAKLCKIERALQTADWRNLAFTFGNGNVSNWDCFDPQIPNNCSHTNFNDTDLDFMMCAQSLSEQICFSLKHVLTLKVKHLL